VRVIPDLSRSLLCMICIKCYSSSSHLRSRSRNTSALQQPQNSCAGFRSKLKTLLAYRLHLLHVPVSRPQKQDWHSLHEQVDIRPSSNVLLIAQRCSMSMSPAGHIVSHLGLEFLLSNSMRTLELPLAMLAQEATRPA